MAELQHIPRRDTSAIVRMEARANALAARALQGLRATEEAEHWLKKGLEARQRCFDEARASNEPYWDDPNGRLEEAFVCFERGIQLNPNHPQLQFMLGESYSDGEGVRRDDRKAFLWTTKAAEQGYADAQEALGYMYTNRLSGLDYGIPLDDERGAYWFRRAAEQGHVGSQAMIGWFYGNGIGVEQDTAEAARWYRRAAEQGNAAAQYNLGRLLHEGNGIEQDHTEALAWYSKAAEQGDSDAKQAIMEFIRPGLVPRSAYRPPP